MTQVVIQNDIQDDVVLAGAIYENPATVISHNILSSGIGGDPVGTAQALLDVHEDGNSGSWDHDLFWTNANQAAFVADDDPLPQYVLTSELGDPDIAGAILKAEPAPYLVNYEPGGNLDTPLQAALDQAHADGGGQVFIPPGVNWTGSAEITVYENTELFMYGVKRTFTGTGDAFILDNTDGTGAENGPHVRGGWLIGTSAAKGAYLLQDTNACRVSDQKITGFIGSGGDIVNNIRGYAFHLRNVNHWTELTRVFNCDMSGNRHAIVFSGSTVTGGAGTNSFARTRFLFCTISGGSALYPLVLFRGNPYHSSFTHIGGNIPASVSVFAFESGQMGGTVLSELGFERTGAGASLFAMIGAGPSIMPVITGLANVLSPMAYWSGTAGEFGAVTLWGAREFTWRTSHPGVASADSTRLYFYTDGFPYVRGPSGSQRQLAEKVAHVDAHINNATDAHDASAISATAHGSISSTTVQAQLQEIEAEVVAVGTPIAHVAYDTGTDEWPDRPTATLVIWSSPDPRAHGEPPEFAAGDLFTVSDPMTLVLSEDVGIIDEVTAAEYAGLTPEEGTFYIENG